jgi:hypothetical protein
MVTVKEGDANETANSDGGTRGGALNSVIIEGMFILLRVHECNNKYDLEAARVGSNIRKR